MPISSYLGNRSRFSGGGWTRSFLPTTTATTTTSSPSSKSKLPRKSRRRAQLKAFVWAHYFTIGLFLSLLLLTFALFRFGPFSLSTPHSRRSTTRPRKHNLRRPLISPLNDGVSNLVAVDITTKDLYEKIEFLDLDGGPWKQGWVVSYKGNEWENEKLKIFVVPHSHNDPGWKLTVDEYYDRQSRHILDTIVESLSKDSRRKFIWEEMSYLERWWRDSSESKREAFANLVKNGQLEIVGGGWVMNDEANSHYYAIIKQMTEGNMWLNETIGVIPRNAWAIDPFGYSPTMAYLLRRMGFENMLIQRTHYELKKELALHKNLEFIWRQSWDAMETTDMFVHMMPFYSYDIPHTCGPEPAVCCQFDFARMRGFMYELCPWGQHPEETNQDNVQERALKLLDQYRKKSTLYRTNTLLIPLGDDFRYVSIEEADVQFRNYQMLFDYINSNPSLNAVAKFGTLDDYFQTLREEAERVNYSRPGEIGSGEIEGFPSLSGDFFTYSDRQQDYWSGYYVSRPFFKAVDRVLEHTLRASEMLMALLLGRCNRLQLEKLPISYAHKLTAARRNLALFQHHDGVTGTAKNYVVRDYGTRMHTSLQDLQIFMSKAIEVLLGIRIEKNEQNPSQFEPEQVRSKYDAHPIHKGIIVQENSATSVVIFNPLEQTRTEVVMVITDRPDVSVLDANWTCIESQVSPEIQHNKDDIFTGRHRVHFEASIPAMGLQMFYLVHGAEHCERAKLSELKFLSNSDLPCPSPYVCSKVEGDSVKIQNRHRTLTFSANLGLLIKIENDDDSLYNVDEEISMYSSDGSGAYLFKPIGDAQPFIETGGKLVVTTGPLMKEVYSYPKTKWDESPISHSTRLYNGENTIQEFVIEKEYHVEFIGDKFNDKELIVRYKTDIENKRIFFSDLNGFQMSRRETYDKIPVQGNYYPMPSLAFMQGFDGRRFSVHSRQSLGVASLKNGWLEIMLDRRVPNDDGRGLGQGVTDNRAMAVVFHILPETNISSVIDPTSKSLPLNPSLLSHCVGAHLNHPAHSFIAKKAQELGPQPPPPHLFSPLTSPLPCDLHIVDFKVPRPSKFSFLEHPVEDPRFVILFQRRGWDSSYCRTAKSHCTKLADQPINIFKLFKDMKVLRIKAVSLNLLHDDTEMLGYTELSGDVVQEGYIVIPPMEIQAYKLEIQPNQ